MTKFLNSLKGRLADTRRKEDGGPTVEFVLVFMPFFLLVVSAFELGLLMTRHVMMERGMDMAMREVRLNTADQITPEDMRALICNSAGIIPKCDERLRLEMIPVDMWVNNGMSATNVSRNAPCIDDADPAQPANGSFSNGTANQVMVVRACARLVPMLPETALGWFLSRMDNGYYRLVSTSAFVMEPIDNG